MKRDCRCYEGKGDFDFIRSAARKGAEYQQAALDEVLSLRRGWNKWGIKCD
jgi:hypothetical protein